MPFAQSVHPFAVVALEGFPFVQLELGVADADVAAEGFEHLAAVERASRDHGHRHGVRKRGVELRLVDVDADSDDRAGERLPGVAVFDQDADQLFVPGIDVVGPLDARRDAELREGVGESEGHGLVEQELFAGGQEPGFEHQREGEVQTLGARPFMAPLAAAGGLPLGPDDVAVAVFRVAGVVVGRGGLFDAVNHVYTDTPKSRRASFSEVFLSVDSLRRPMISAHVTLYSPAGNCLR